MGLISAHLFPRNWMAYDRFYNIPFGYSLCFIFIWLVSVLCCFVALSLTVLDISQIFYLSDFQNYAFSWSVFIEYRKLKSTYPTGSITCHGPSGNRICQALIDIQMQPDLVTTLLYIFILFVLYIYTHKGHSCSCELYCECIVWPISCTCRLFICDIML